jgi:hypothetical protein
MKIYKLNEYGHGSHEENDIDYQEQTYTLTDKQISELSKKINDKIVSLNNTSLNDKGIKKSIENTIKKYLKKL